VAEIKSTLEIALEKAKAVEISSEDRKRFKQEEIRSKARDIFQRYTNHPSRLDSLTKTIRESGDDESLLRECLKDRFLDVLDLSDPSQRIWEGLRELGLENPEPFREALRHMAEESDKIRQEGVENVKKMVRQSLSESGISGTAIDPNIDEAPQWKDIVKSLDQSTSDGLARLRQKIARAIRKHSSSAR
jgi:hypothetical protein